MKTIACWSLLFLICFSVAEPVSAVVIGGSNLCSPPQYLENSFLVGMVGSRLEAYPFQIIAVGEWTVDSLEVPLFHYEGMAGDSASFSIWSDTDGLPGSPLVTFSVSDITTEAQIYSLAPLSAEGPLEGGETYWLVGMNSGSGQVNWNMERNTGSYDRAYCYSDGDWVAQSNLCNTSAFAVIGSAVPEPSGIALLSLAAVGLLACRRRSQVG